MLAAGSVLPGKTPVSFDDAMAKIEEIGSSVQSFLGGGEAGGAGGGFSTLIDSIRATSDELRALIVENRANLGGTVQNFERFSETLARELPRITEQIAHVLDQVQGVLAENRGNLKDSVANIKELTDKVQTSVDNLNEITTKIASGEGTIGKLVNSDEAHDSADERARQRREGGHRARGHAQPGERPEDRSRNGGVVSLGGQGLSVRFHRSTSCRTAIRARATTASSSYRIRADESPNATTSTR